jgi:hypothetical protein
MKKPSKGNIPCSPSGIKSMKAEKWDELYKWQLLEYGGQSHKIITSIPLKEYYELGHTCIKNNISISMFLKTAMRENLKDITKITKKIKRDAKPKEDSRQGVLF